MTTDEYPLIVHRGDVRELWLLPRPETNRDGQRPAEGRHVADLLREPPRGRWVARAPGDGRSLATSWSLDGLVRKFIKHQPKGDGHADP